MYDLERSSHARARACVCNSVVKLMRMQRFHPWWQCSVSLLVAHGSGQFSCVLQAEFGSMWDVIPTHVLMEEHALKCTVEKCILLLCGRTGRILLATCDIKLLSR